eukprot:scaffold735_cov116-Cylindrotheca_fusiformis.AAC.30
MTCLIEEDPATAIGKHEGECSNNSKYSPAEQEEHGLERIGRSLLLDDNGEYLGDNRALLIEVVVSDGDSKGALRMLRVQEAITSYNGGRREPCFTHVSKGTNNGMYKLREKDTTLKGVGGLENRRIQFILCDIQRQIDDLKHISWDVGKAPTLQQIEETLEANLNVVCHHCGKHSHCNEKHCKLLKLVTQRHGHGVFLHNLSKADEEVLYDEYYQSSNRYSYELKLNEVGIRKVQDEILKRFNKQSLMNLSKKRNTNLAESFWGMQTKYSEGKRLNQNYSKSWEDGLALCILRLSDDTTYPTLRLQERLGIPISIAQDYILENLVRLRSKRKEAKQHEQYKQTRRLTKVLKKYHGSNSAKKYRYKQEQVKPETTKLKTKRKQRSSPSCGNCGDPGHTKRFCDAPAPRNLVLLEESPFADKTNFY